jgi:hypothetical protein
MHESFPNPNVSTPSPSGRYFHRTALARRDMFVWAAAIMLSNQLLSTITGSSSPADTSLLAISKPLADLIAIGIFPFMAWYAIFRLLAGSDPTPPGTWRDFLLTALPCLLLFLPISRIWVVASVIGTYLLVCGSGDRNLRAAGVVLAALSVQQFWAYFFFDIFGSQLLRIETAAVGMMLHATRPGTVWYDNVITAPNGYGIVVYGGCSSFQNLCLAFLCWTTLMSLRRYSPQVRDLVKGILIGGTVILLNLGRLYLMAWNFDLYHYWHDGAGSQIFEIGTSLIVLFLILHWTKPHGEVK